MRVLLKANGRTDAKPHSKANPVIPISIVRMLNCHFLRSVGKGGGSGGESADDMGYSM